MIVVVCTWEMEIPGSRSLKDKRSVLRSLKDRLAAMNVSVAESGLQDACGRCRISVAFLAAHNAQADSMLASVERRVEGTRDARVASRAVERR